MGVVVRPTGQISDIKMKVFLVLMSLSVFCSFAAVVKRQTEPGQFDLFGQVLTSFHEMLNTLGSEGGRFVARQTEVNQPTLNTVGNITDTIGRSEFVQTVHQVPASVSNGDSQRFIGDNVELASSAMGLMSSLSCALLCPNSDNCSFP